MTRFDENESLSRIPPYLLDLHVPLPPRQQRRAAVARNVLRPLARVWRYVGTEERRGEEEIMCVNYY